MTDRELERRLKTAVAHAAPDDVEGVLSRCEARKGTVIPMTRKNNSRAFRGLVAACLTLTLFVGGGLVFYQQANAVASVVSIDVNPSIELKVNRKSMILSCTPLNNEAREVLADMGGGADLKGAKLKVGVNAIVGALVGHGYLDSISSAILLSVEDKDTKRSEMIQAELTGVVDTVLAERFAQATVLSQTVAQEAALETLSRENNLSLGKASLIGQVLEMNGAVSMNSDAALEQLSKLSVEELYDLLSTRETRIPIGKEAARAAAEAYAGMSAAGSSTAEVDAELDESPACYEVELHTAMGEFEYIVDAFTGKVLRGEKDISASARVSAAPAAPTQSAASTAPAAPAQRAASTDDIGAAKAKSIALAHAGLNEAQVTRLKTERDWDDGRLEYEVEFVSDGMEYDYTIDAGSGKIIAFDRERDD